MECDASGQGIKIVLSHNQRPIAYFIKALNDSSLSKSIYEKELIALVLSIQHWRPYLLRQIYGAYGSKKFEIFIGARINRIGWPSFWVMNLKLNIDKGCLIEWQSRKLED